ncbi:MAG: CvpA family protein [Acidimicrobiia bacterium]
MTWLDLVVLVAVALGGLVGFRVGFVVRALSWLGLSVGIGIGLRLTPRLARSLNGSTPGIRLLAVASLLIGLALIGHTTGLVISQVLRKKFALDGRTSPLDRLAGGVLGALGVLALLWLLIPALRSTPGWPARESRDSSLVAVIDTYGPTQPQAAKLVGRIVGESPYPLFDDAEVAARPPTADAGPRVDAVGAGSVVLVRGHACGLELSGTGFAVGPHLVITNAHVIAGEQRVEIVTRDGQTVDARPVAFDGRHDVAVLEVTALRLRPLHLAAPRIGTVASVLGHPRGGNLRATPARVARWIGTPRTDIYRNHTIETRIVGLAARLIVGDSGAPVIGPDGRVQAMVFAVDPADPDTAFALSSAEFGPFVRLARTATRAAATGSCLG